jgi:hypothetical protein
MGFLRIRFLYFQHGEQTMKKIRAFKMLVLTTVFVAFFAGLTTAQETDLKKYAKDGLTFEVPTGWEVEEQPATGLQQIIIANKETDSQILLRVLNQKMESKDPMPELKKKVIDPWVTQLVDGYARNNIPLKQSPAATEVGAEKAEGIKLNFFLDDQPGGAEAYWVLLDKRLVLLYFIRPDKTSDKATLGWDAIRKSLHVETVAVTKAKT